MARYKITDKAKQVEINSVIFKTGDTVDSDMFNNVKPVDATNEWTPEEESLLKSGHICLTE